MIGAATIINPLIKVATTVAILAAVYFFIVKPVLDTSERAFNSPAFGGLSEVGPQIRKSVREAQRLQTSQASGSKQQVDQADKLLACIRRADNDVDKIERCGAKYSP